MKKTYLIVAIALVLLLGQTAFTGTSMPGGRLTGVNWFGFETSNYVVHGLWIRDYKSMLQQISDLGFNCLRLPWCNEMIGMDPNSIQINASGTDPYTGETGLNLDLEGLSALEVLDKIIEEAGRLGLKIILDNHSAHISKETREYLSTVPNRFDFVFTPTHGSWLNIIESLFAKMAKTFLRGIRVNSKAQLKQRILKWIDELNESPIVFRWKWKLDTIS